MAHVEIGWNACEEVPKRPAFVGIFVGIFVTGKIKTKHSWGMQTIV